MIGRKAAAVAVLEVISVRKMMRARTMSTAGGPPISFGPSPIRAESPLAVNIAERDSPPAEQQQDSRRRRRRRRSRSRAHPAVAPPSSSSTTTSRSSARRPARTSGSGSSCRNRVTGDPFRRARTNVAAQLLARESGVDDHEPMARMPLPTGEWVTL